MRLNKRGIKGSLKQHGCFYKGLERGKRAKGIPQGHGEGRKVCKELWGREG